MATLLLDAENGGMPRLPARSGRPDPHERRPRDNFIRRWRKFRRLTLEQLSERSGVSTSAISNIEKSKHGYQWDTLEDLADALGCEVGDLLSRPPDDEPDPLLAEIASLDDVTRDQVRDIIGVLKRARR